MRFTRQTLLLAAFALSLVLAGPAGAEDEAAGWEGKLRLGGSIKEGNNDSASLDINAEIGRKWEQDSVRVLGHFGYGTSDGDKNKDEQSISEEYRHFFSERFFLAVNATQERDTIQAIDIRLLTNAGPGWRVYETSPKQYFDLEAGFGHRYERFDTGENRSDATARFGAELAHVFNESIEFTQDADFLLPLSDTNSWLAQARTYLAMPLSEQWFFTNTLILEWLNEPAQTATAELDEFDLTYTVALELRF